MGWMVAFSACNGYIGEESSVGVGLGEIDGEDVGFAPGGAFYVGGCGLEGLGGAGGEDEVVAVGGGDLG